MNKKILILAAFILALPTAQALQISSLNITFDLKEDRSVQQTLKYKFTTPVSKILNYTIGEEVNNVQARANGEKADYRLQDGKISIKAQNTSTLTISFKKENAVYTNTDNKFFYTEFSFENPVEKINSEIILPPGHTITNNAYKPEDSKTGSDGQRITLMWMGKQVEEQLFTVKYSKTEQKTGVWIVLITFLAVIIAYMFNYYQQKTRKEFLQGFREDEKKVIQYLEEKEECMQKDLHREFGLGRAKTTRIVKKLEEKGLVEKESHGRTNKLKWVK